MAVRSRAYAWYILILLTSLNVVNYMDRMVIVTMHDDLRARFGFSDTELGAFWSAFFAVHAILIIPFGWASDRYNRIKIMAAGVIGWSLATLGSAYAIGFFSLLVLRGLIGLGEAAYGPVSNALLCEVFKPSEKARTVGIYNGGMFLGSCVGLVGGALLGFPLAFQVVALPGIVLGVLVLFLDVPARRADITPEERRLSLRAVVKDALRTLNVRSLHWLLAGGILISFTAGGYISWVADFMEKYKGFQKDEASVALLLITLTAGIGGVIIGGLLADRWQKRFLHGRVLTIAVGFASSVPFALGTLFIDRGAIFFVCLWLFTFFIPWYNGPMAAVIDDVVDDKDANTAQAAFACILHLLGTAPASLVVGFVSERASLRVALLIPTFATLAAAACCLVACRHVARDMEARAQRASKAIKAAAEN